MAKLNRSALKSIIKECLVEILSEGLGETTGIQLTESRPRSQRRKKMPRAVPESQQRKSRRPVLDNVSFNKKVDERVSGLTDDPIMASIFKDTATTTLQEQATIDSQKVSHEEQIQANGDAAAQVISKADPTDVFSEAASNWATLAFS